MLAAEGRTMRELFWALAVLAAGPDARPPPLPAAITAEAAGAYYACRYWTPATNWGLRPTAGAERIALRVARGVTRRGARLRIGDQSFHDERGGEEVDRVTFRYAGRLVGAPGQLVLKRPYESFGWLLVSSDAGPIELPGVPLASPRGHAMAAAASDPVFRQSGLVIVENRMAGLTVAAEFPEARYPCDLHWETEDRLVLKVALFDFEGAPNRWVPATVQREDGGWVFRGPSER
jgi:hypothetical protein